MEGKAGGEGKSKRVSKEELLHPFSTKKINGERSDLEKVIIALLVFGLAWLSSVWFCSVVCWLLVSRYSEEDTTTAR